MVTTTEHVGNQHRAKPSRPNRTARMHVSYREESPEESSNDLVKSDNLLHQHITRSQRSSRPARSRRNQLSYHEQSSSEDILDNDFEPLFEPSTSLQARRKTQPPKASPARGRKRRSNNLISVGSLTKPTPHKRRKTAGETKGKDQEQETNGKDQERDGVHRSDGIAKTPPWQTLPYHILYQVFGHASYPLYDHYSRPNSSIQWLLNMSCLCKSFHEAALSAFYYSPPIFPAYRCHGLLNLLAKPQESLSMNYRNKIKRLDVEVVNLLVYKSGKDLGYLDIYNLLRYTPQIKELHLYHNSDCLGRFQWPQRPSHTKWSYPESMFDTLDTQSICLRSWEWNARFPDSIRLISQLRGVHLRPAFQRLRELTLINFSFPPPRKSSEQTQHPEDSLAAAISDLADLQYLEFRKCSIINQTLLAGLPSCLQHLSIINCKGITSELLQPFLASHGQHLHELVLNHNQDLSMSFLVDLASSCPQLKVFEMDHTYLDTSAYHDLEPHYKSLLRSDEIPTWPTTLHTINLIQLRNWEAAAAENFFKSLIESAADLRCLRKLVLKVILKIEWRDRASFREKWISRLEQVFRLSAPPQQPNSAAKTVNASTDASWQAELVSTGRKNLPETSSMTIGSSQERSNAGTRTKRKSARISQLKVDEINDVLMSKPVPTPGLSSYHSEADPSSKGDQRWQKQKERFVHGMCDVVKVRIDNLRPAEAQYTEADFLDDEQSGDEDWDGTDLAPANGHAW